jgi:hypothetical protein
MAKKRKSFEENPSVPSNDKGQDPPRSTWPYQERIIGPDIVDVGGGWKAALRPRHPHHRYTAASAGMDQRADDAGVNSRRDTQYHLRDRSYRNKEGQ